VAKQDILDRAYIKMAANWGNDLSQAKRLKVGAIIVKDGQIISDGFNGMPSGMDNVCENRFSVTKEEYYKDIDGIPWDNESAFKDDFDGYDHITEEFECLRTKPEVLHAESNALMKLARSTNSSVGATIYCSYSSCFDCSKLIIQAGIVRCVYLYEYRLTDGIDLLKKCGVKVDKLNYKDIYQ